MECDHGSGCPYLGGGDVRRLTAERDYLSRRVEEMERVMALAEAEIARLRQENQDLQRQREGLRCELKQWLGKVFKPQRKPRVDRPRGAPCGHRGHSRRRPQQISETVDVYPTRCHRCGGEVKGYEESFDVHVVEDIEIKKRTTCYRLHRGYCPSCRRVVRPKAAEATIPRERVGVQARAIATYLRYLGLPYRKVAKAFRDVFDLDLTHPSLLNFNAKQAQNGAALYQGIKQSVRESPYVNADETGWRVDGQNYWLWVFTNKDATLYRIAKSRGGEVVRDVLGEEYPGVLASDFYSAYNEVKALAKQRCAAHLLREIKKIQETPAFPAQGTDGVFCQGVKKVLQEAIAVWREHRNGPDALAALGSEKERVIPKMIELLSLPLEHEDARRIRKRLIKHNNELFTFLDNPLIEPTNNRAERQLRPNVIMRKVTFGNRSASGASDHAIITSIIHTAISNGIQPMKVFLALTTGPQTSFTELPRIRSP